MKTVWYEELQVRHTEIGPDGSLSTRSFFDYMQLAAGNHADHLGVGLYLLHEKNMLWVLSRIKLLVTRFPKLGEVVKIKTYPTGFKRLFATRQFNLTGVNDSPVAVASSCWLVLNAATFRPQNLNDVFGDNVPCNPDEKRFFPELDKLHTESPGNPLELTVRQSQMDVNRHLNNSFYASMSEDWIASKLNKIIRIREIQINFNTDLKMNDTVVYAGNIAGDSFQVAGQTLAGNNVFQSAGIFEHA